MSKSSASNPALNAWQRWRVFALAWLVLSLLSASWSIATPIGAAPDEPSHIIKAAAVALGELSGKSTADGQAVRVPSYIAYTPAQTCYAYNPQVTPVCSAPPHGDQAALVPSATSAGLYNPLYYAMVGWPSLIFHDDSGVYAMRIVSGIISSLFLAAALMMISTWRRRLFPVLGFAVAATPMVFFLNGVVNPNSLETTATLAAFIAVLSIVLKDDPRLLVERSVIAMVAAGVAVNTRGLSPLWVAVAVLAPFILSSWKDIRELIRRPVVIVAVIVIGLSAAAALAWTALSNSLGAGLTPTTDTATGLGVGASPLRGFAQVLAGTFDYGQGIVGVFGWLDTPVPSPVFFLWSGFIAAVVIGSIVLLRGRPLAFSVTMIGALVLLPPITQAAYITGGGIVWQGRYALALFVCVILGLATLLSLRIPEHQSHIRRRLMVVVLACWAFAQFYSFAFALKRYGVGASGTSWKVLLFNPTWAPPSGVPLALLACGVFVVLISVLLFSLAQKPKLPAFE